MHWVALTRVSDGVTIMINMAALDFIAPVTVGSLLGFSGGSLVEVRETMAEIVQQMDAQT